MTRSGVQFLPPMVAACGVALLLALASSAPAQEAEPSAGTDATGAAARIEQQPIRRNASPRPGSPESDQKPVPAPVGGLDVTRVLLAVGLVVGLIILLRVLVRWLFPSVSAARSTQAIRVICRAVISPKQQVLLLQVGRRVIVVGDSGTQMNPLCEIADADEIAQLMGQIESGQRTSARTFLPFFRREREQFEAIEQQQPSEDAEQPAADGSPEAAQADDRLANAQGELRGLMDQVRMLGRQFRRS